MAPRTSREALLGNSPGIQALRGQIGTAADSGAKVLIVGETGVGKDVVARLIHQGSARSAAPFVALNCAGLPDSLLASELFGHVQGSFTGAYRDKRGLIRQADGGTLFLDELAEMSLAMQALLLRFAETGEIQPVGAETPAGTVDVRLICATNRDLRHDMEEGRFRGDLYYRLNVMQIRVPPLRDRENDVLLLFHHYLQVAAETHGTPVPELTPDAAQLLLAYSWPGNVRELRNVTERLALAELPAITTNVLPREILEWAGGRGLLLEESPDGMPPTQADLVEALWARLMAGEDFWTVVGESYKTHALTSAALVALIDRGLRQTHGSYRALLALFNLPPSDYKRFHGYLYQRGCHVPVRQYRGLTPDPPSSR